MHYSHIQEQLLYFELLKTKYINVTNTLLEIILQATLGGRLQKYSSSRFYSLILPYSQTTLWQIKLIVGFNKVM